MGYEYNNNNNRNYYDNVRSIFSLIGELLTLGIVGAGLYFTFLSVVFIGKTLFTAVISLTVPALIKSLFTFSAAELSVISCVKVALEGVFVGLFIGCIRRLHIKKKLLKKFSNKQIEVGKSWISELLTFDVFNLEINLVFVILLNMLVGFVVGWVQGVAGTPGIIQAIFGKVNYTNTIIGALIQGGGAGGAGTGNPFSFVLFILIIFIVQGIITGAATGLTFGILFGAISGAIKTGSTELLSSALSNTKNSPPTKGRKIFRSTIKGVIQGAIVGGIVGFIQGIITLIMVSSSKKTRN